MTEQAYNELDHVAALDLETSGLDEQNDQILEVAVIFGAVKDGKFTELRRFERVLPLATNIDYWHEKVLEMHTTNGLLAAAVAKKKAFRSRDDGDDLDAAFRECDRELLRVAPPLPNHKARWTLLGNTVHFDLRFVRRVFPQFAARLSHRVIDVSSTRLFCEGLGMVTERTDPPHRALPDVLGSIAQYEKQSAWVRETFEHVVAEGAGFATPSPTEVVAEFQRAVTDVFGSSWERGGLGSTEVGHGAG